MSNLFALKARNGGLILGLVLSPFLVLELLLVGVKNISIIALFQVFLQTSDLGLELINFLYMVSFNTRNKRISGSRNFMVRATRQGEQFIMRCTISRREELQGLAHGNKH
jgi:hypothetical protein